MSDVSASLVVSGVCLLQVCTVSGLLQRFKLGHVDLLKVLDSSGGSSNVIVHTSEVSSHSVTLSDPLRSAIVESSNFSTHVVAVCLHGLELIGESGQSGSVLFNLDGSCVGFLTSLVGTKALVSKHTLGVVEIIAQNHIAVLLISEAASQLVESILVVGDLTRLLVDDVCGVDAVASLVVTEHAEVVLTIADFI